MGMINVPQLAYIILIHAGFLTVNQPCCVTRWTSHCDGKASRALRFSNWLREMHSSHGQQAVREPSQNTARLCDCSSSPWLQNRSLACMQNQSSLAWTTHPWVISMEYMHLSFNNQWTHNHTCPRFNAAAGLLFSWVSFCNRITLKSNDVNGIMWGFISASLRIRVTRWICDICNIA